MTIKQAHENLFKAIDAWLKAGPTKKHVEELLYGLADTFDDVPTIAHFNTAGGFLEPHFNVPGVQNKKVCACAVISSRLYELACRLEAEHEYVEPEEELDDFDLREKYWPSLESWQKL